MKRYVIPGIILLTLFIHVTSATAAAPKVAFVNATKVVEESPQYESARTNLEQEFSRRNNDLVDKQKQLKKLEEKLERDAAIMSTEEAQRLERDILLRRRKLKNSQDEFREDFTLRRNELINKLRKQVAEVVREVGKREDIDLIMSDGVVYFSPRIDISDKVLELLHVKFKAGRKK